MDCRDFQKFVHVYVDGEMDARDQGEIQGHLRVCGPCRRQAQFEQAFSAAVKRALPPEAPPPYLEARVRARLAEVVAQSRWAFLRALTVPAAATVAVGGLAAYVWLRAPEEPPTLAPASAVSVRAPAQNAAVAMGSPTTPMAMSPSPAPIKPAPRPGAGAVRAVADPRPMRAPRVVEAASGDRDLGIQFASSNLGRVRAFLESELDTPLRVPSFRGHARVVGGSASREDATAQVVYRHKKDHLYVHIRPRHDPTLPPRGIVLRQENGHRVAAWQQDGLTFSMTSRLDPVEMVRLVAAELNEVVRRERPAPAEPLYSPAPTPDIRPASMSISD